MFLRELFDRTDTVGIIFGRFNPPHKGHRTAWQMVSESDYWYVGTNRNTHGQTNPLLFEDKVNAMKTIYPKVDGHIVAETGWLTLASRVYNEHGSAILKCYTDEDWVVETIKKYNGLENKHGFYDFKSIIQVKTPRESSATALREAASKCNLHEFVESSGVPADTLVSGVPYYNLVVESLDKMQEVSVGYVDVAKLSPGVQVTHSFLPKGGIVQSVKGNTVFVKALHDNRLYRFNIQNVSVSECAGVGIITKQNSTADVGPGTLRKNLEAFGLTGKIPKKSKKKKDAAV